MSSGPDEIYQTANLYGRGAGQTCRRCLTVLRMEGTIRNYYGIKGEKGVLNNFVKASHDNKQATGCQCQQTINGTEFCPFLAGKINLHYYYYYY